MLFDHDLGVLGEHPSPMLVIDPDNGAIIAANEAAARFYGWSRAELRSRRITDINTMSADEVTAQMRRVVDRFTSRLHFRHRLADGSERLVEVHSGPIQVEGRRLLCSIIIDETPRVEAERALARRDRLYAMLSETNQRIIRVQDRDELLTSVCRVAVEQGGFLFAWVGMVDAGGHVVPVARAGHDGGYVDRVMASVLPDDPRSRGPAGRAILTGEPAVVNDFLEEPDTVPWRELATTLGLRSVAAFPLREEGRAVGILALYASEPGFFSTPELATLGAMAADVSHGLDMLGSTARRMKAEAQVAAWNQRLEQYLESSPSISYALTVTPDGFRPEWVSANAERILGYPVAELMAPDWWITHVHPDDRAAAATAVGTALSEGTARHEYRFLTADGRELWVLDALRHTPGPGGTRGRINGTWSDVTAQHRVLDRLRESEERLRLAVSATRQGLWDLDLVTGTLRVAEPGELLPGQEPTMSMETMESRRARMHPDDLPHHLQVFQDYVEGRLPEYRVEYRLRSADGAWRWLLSLGSAVTRDGAGRPLRMLGTHADITEARRAEGALRLLGSALDAAADAMVITDRSGLVEWANPAFTALTGYSVQEAVGRRPGDLVRSGTQSRAFYAEMWRTILDGKVWRGELINKRKDGTLYPESLTITPVRGERGDIQHFVAIKRDLTADHLLRESLLQAQKMESVGRLAGGVAHDFNNLLTVINGSIELALGAVPPDAPVREDLLDIRQAADRAAALTRQLLAFSRRQILRRHLVDAGKLVEDLSKLLGRLIGDDIVLVTDLPHSDARVLADPGQLEQVVMNLVVNARDAMPRGGTLTISTAEMDVDAHKASMHGDVVPGRYVRVAVKDTGLGMEPSVRERIFEPFFTTKAAGQGTGLGLSTVYGIVHQSGGFITVDSTVGVGSVFHVFLPVATSADEATRTPLAGTPQVGPPPARARGAVLVVDDEPALRRIAMKVLERSGFRVFGAGNADEALRVLDEHGDDIQLLLTDVVMPGRSGPELAEEMQKRRPGLKVLFASGYTDDMVLRHGVDGSTMEFLGKPYTQRELVGRVSALLSS